jgi:hypothetical protein
MLRPTDVLNLFKIMASTSRSDLLQLLDGLNVGGVIIMGGSPKNAQMAERMMTQGNMRRLGQIRALTQIRPDELKPERHLYSFDLAAIAQLIMLAQNETYHQTIETTVEVLTKMNDDGQDLAFAITCLEDMATKVQKL